MTILEKIGLRAFYGTSQVGRRLSRTGVLAANLVLLPAAIGCVDKSSVPIVSNPDDFRDKAALLIAELNALIPQKPVRGLVSANGTCEAPSYSPDDHKLIYSASFGLDSVVHEMGHAIYAVLLDEKGTEFSFRVKDELWKNIYFLSLGHGNYELVKDSNYVAKIICGGIDLTQKAGHPFENPNELFASSLMIYRLHADQLIAKIFDPAISPESREFGKLIFLYMKKAFKGKVFSRSDPWPNETIDNYRPGQIEDKAFNTLTDVLTGGLSAKADLDLDVQIWFRAWPGIFSSNVRDDRFYGLIEKAFTLADDLVAFKALLLDMIARSNDLQYPLSLERIIPLILKALNDDNPFVQLHAARAVDSLGLNDKRFSEPFIKALNNVELSVQLLAIKYLSANGDQSAIPALENLQNDREPVKTAAKEAVKVIKARTNPGPVQ